MNSMEKTGHDQTCPDGLRNRFFQRKRMLAKDFQIEQDYLNGRRRLLSRSVLGWGVVYGFAIEGAKEIAGCIGAGDPHAGKGEPAQAPGATPAGNAAAQAAPIDTSSKPDQASSKAPHELSVAAGFGLDAGGREAVLREAVTLTAENTLLLVRVNGVWSPRRIDADMKPGRYMLAVHYAERVAGTTVPASFCCCRDEQWTHSCETVIFSLRSLESELCGCGEPECPGAPCACDACAGDPRSHARLVQWATARVAAEASHLRPWDPFQVALDAPIDLACVQIAGVPERCKPLEFVDIDASSPRRLVKTNDALYDLIRGCDLTHIEKVSWGPWHRNRTPVEFNDFAAFFNAQDLDKDSLLTKFSVLFSGPVLRESVRRDVMAITVQMVDGGTGWVRSRRIPISALDTTPSNKSLPTNMTDQFTVAVAKRWVRDEIDQSGESYLSERDFVVEIEVRGDLIEDCSGQTVDANAIGRRAYPTGNGSPGGTYFSSFKVKRSMRSQAEDSERTAR
ncbi:hypothetical protein FJN17_07955 [Bradyrhizobium symbiodeficiens]|uniref:EF-hand domain-containing protein n=1 Tax=Bradyrhizobium symbiodeficiens TaxID=1404367 RepID=A0ABX5W3E7_9BRAD|nr:hypothetical protein [Bradyrhizobium symbiodeficiens]QDF37504.1 hypothetical protein FJN17_07955 [Bradyrhizobium symbiodeficiens]